MTGQIPPALRQFVDLSMNGTPSTPYQPPQVQVRPPIKVRGTFVAVEHRPPPSTYDGKYRVVLVTTDSPGSAYMPSLVGTLCKDPTFDLQVVATLSSLRYYSQKALDEAVRLSWNLLDDGKGPEWGVRRWTDTDEAEAWHKPGDPVLAAELASWADLVVVAPASADTIAKIVAGFSDSLALSLLRSLPPTTPVLICPEMTPQMLLNPFTSKHDAALRSMGHIILGPNQPNRPLRGLAPARPRDLTPEKSGGQMSDWRDIINVIQDMAALHGVREAQAAAERAGDPSSGPANSGYAPRYERERLGVQILSDPMSFEEQIRKSGSPESAIADAKAERQARIRREGGALFLEGEGPRSTISDLGPGVSVLGLGLAHPSSASTAPAQRPDPPSRVRFEAENGATSSTTRDGPNLSEKSKKEQGEKSPPLPVPFSAMRMGWGEASSATDPDFVWPVPGLPSTRRPDEMKLGAEVERLSSNYESLYLLYGRQENTGPSTSASASAPNPGQTRHGPGENAANAAGKKNPPAFSALRALYGDAVSVSDPDYVWPIAGLASTRTPGESGVGPRADSLSQVPYQFSSADHWRHMSETGYWNKKWWMGGS